MSSDKDLASHIIARGERVILRRWLASDVDQFIYWLSHGEWRLIDAPWHGYRTETTAEQEKRDREWFTQQLNGGEESWLGKRAVIATLEGIPLGWVNRYSEEKNPHVCYVGISICEDAYLNHGWEPRLCDYGSITCLPVRIGTSLGWRRGPLTHG